MKILLLLLSALFLWMQTAGAHTVYRLLCEQEKNPIGIETMQPRFSWQLAHGATALTESWQAYGFVSNNHFMLGHLMEWLFSGLGGIRQVDGSVGYKHIVIRPEPVGDVRSASTTYQLPYGQIVSDWKEDGNNFSIRVEVPAGSRASVYLPATEAAKITESGQFLKDVSAIRNQKVSGNYTIVEIGSGIYTFKVDK